MKKVSETLKIQIQGILQDCKIICHSSNAGLESDSEDLKDLLLLIQNKSLRFQQNDDCVGKISRSNLTTSEDNRKEVPKKRGRKTKTSTLSSEPKSRSDSSDNRSLNDSSASTSSTRSRRAAAQVAEQKLAQVQSLVQLKTKLRRPTNFDEKQVNVALSPPSKCRRTHRNQSAGSSSSQTDEANNREASKNILVTDNENLKDDCLNAGCLVSLTKLNTPTIKSYTHPSCRTSRSLDRTTQRNSEDLFSNPLSELHSKHNESKSDPTHKTNRKKIRKRDLDSGISSTEDELQYFMNPDLPIAQSSPISLQPKIEPVDCEFKGFEEHHRQAALVRENTFVVGLRSEETQILLKKTLKEENQEASSEEIEEIESSVIKTRTKVLRKKGYNTTINVEEKENVNRNNETHIITKEPNSPNLHSKTKVLMKAVDCGENSNHSNSEENSESQQSSPETKARSRTKTIRKHKEQHQDLESGSEVEGQSIRTRTKTIKKDNKNEEQSDSTDNELSNARSRTKTIKKGPNNKINELNSEKSIPEFKDNLPTSKVNLIPPLSPAPAKGELVKKRVEDFEKMQNGIEECEEEKNVGRVTRNAMKSKVTASATEAQSSKNIRNVPLSKSQANSAKQPTPAERLRMTPLGINNRMTPSSDSASKLQANKWASSATRPTPVENNNVALIHKQPTEEAERKKREEERQKRQAKEEEAKKKKEKVLKATAEEARRKRVEKLQKVAATREAAEKEKERLAAKAEKEKEEKLRQIAAEKEKQKEEHLKKKQLMLQKTLEHEERRKQEEAARLAKLKEQEEEHKRYKAMKEREQELQKQQKTELRLAEAEKMKQHGGKLGKIAAINNAKLKTQHGMTPSEKTNGAQPSNCYEITPAREDRPLLPPKTETDYGIDDALSEDSSDDESQPRKMIPVWAQSKNRERLLQVNRYIPKKLWDLFMEGDPCPDINKIFAGNPIKRRIRTSSAVWRTPPKYSRVAP